ncbi:hypothetical protein ACLOJK_014202 [Asimina triloba]
MGCPNFPLLFGRPLLPSAPPAPALNVACPCPCQPSFLVAVVLTSHSSRRGHRLISTLAAIVRTPAAIGELLPLSTRRRLPLVLVADLLTDSRWCHLLAVLVRTPAAIFSPSSSPLIADLPCLATPASPPLIRLPCRPPAECCPLPSASPFPPSYFDFP